MHDMRVKLTQTFGGRKQTVPFQNIPMMRFALLNALKEINIYFEYF